MKFNKFLMIIVIALAEVSGVFAQSGSASLKVTVSGYEGKQGEVMVAVYNNADDFLEKPIKTVHQQATTDKTELTINGLQPGEYALAVYLDENDNQNLDKNLVGIPKEPYGFSNGAKAKLSPPNYADAKMQITDQQNVTSVELE